MRGGPRGGQDLDFGGVVTVSLLMVGAEGRMGGGEVFLHRLARGLSRRPGFRVAMLLPEGAEVAERVRADPDCSAIRVAASRRLVRLGEAGPLRFAASLLGGGREIVAAVRRERHGVVLLNGLGASAYGLLPRLACRCRLVAVHHNIRSSRLETAYGRWLFAGHEMVCVSRAVAAGVRGPLNRGRVRVIPNGVPVGPPPPPGKLGDPGPLRILAAGRITPWKGLHVLLEALGRMRARAGPEPLPVEAEIAGRAWTDEEIEYEGDLRRTVERRGLGAAVRFVGHVPLDGRMERAHCLVHSAVEPEPFGLVVAEAMARGCLVVVSDTGGVREYVEEGETGYLVPPGDPGALAGRLEWLVRHRADSDVARVAERARERIASDHSLDRQVDAYARLLRGGREGRRATAPPRTGRSRPTS